MKDSATIERACCFNAKRVVVKVGTRVLTGDGSYVVDRGVFAHLVQSIALQITEHKRRLVLVSSGAIGLGRRRLGSNKGNGNLTYLQALAALGQSALMQLYEHEFAFYDLLVGQILLTRDDINNRKRFINARHTIKMLAEELGAIPIVNENDTVANEEIRLSDNDWLAALVSTIFEADLLLILSDIPGIMTAPPGSSPDSRIISHIEANDPSLDQLVWSSRSKGGRGGMSTKLEAARMAANAGIPTVIAPGRERATIDRVLAGEPVGTLVVPPDYSIGARRIWLRHGITISGQLVVDAGAEEAIIKRGKSLLPSGVISISGKFGEGEAVEICNPQGLVLARGLVCYSSADIARISGKKSSEIASILGFKSLDAVVHRDDMVLASPDPGQLEPKNKKDSSPQSTTS